MARIGSAVASPIAHPASRNSATLATSNDASAPTVATFSSV